MIRRTSRLAAVVVATAAGLACGHAVAQEVVSVDEIGRSAAGVPIEVVRVGRDVTDRWGRGPDERPAVLVVAGQDGRHTVGPAIAERLAERITESLGDRAGDVTVYIVPRLNPDGVGRLGGRTSRPSDADRDGRIDEDPGNDLNGDGHITMMRIRHPGPRTGLEATLVVDPDDDRLMRAPKPEDGESPEWAVLVEGLDDDGDGRFNEDGPGGAAGGGVVIDHNFPSFWPEHEESAGVYPLSEPESRALASWLIRRPNVQAVYVLGDGDNLHNVPRTGRFGPEGRMPTGLEENDKPWHSEIASWFGDETTLGAGESPDHRGRLHAWTYAELGLWSFVHPGWTRPSADAGDDAADDAGADGEGDDAPDAAARQADEAAEWRAQGVPDEIIALLHGTPESRRAMMAEFQTRPPAAQQAMMASMAALPEDVRARVMAIAQNPEGTGGAEGGNGGGDDAPARGGSSSADGQWLVYSDGQRGGEGFIDWSPFDHPQLGAVEIGGFVPGFRMNPPDGEVEALADQHAAFVAELAARLADVSVVERRATRLGSGVWHVSVTLENNGFLPTTSAIARKARRLPPELLVLETPPDRIVSGNRAQRFEVIAGSGGRVTAEWTVMARGGTSVDVTMRSARFGDRIIQVMLREGE